MPATPRVGLLARRVLGAGVIAAMVAVMLPSTPAQAAGLFVASVNGQPGANAASNTSNATVVIDPDSTFRGSPAPAPTVTLTRAGSNNDRPATSGVTVNEVAGTVTFTAALTSANPGPYDIVVTQTTGPVVTTDSCSACFTVAADRPKVSSTSPATMAQTGSSLLVVQGTSFARGNFPSPNSNYNCAGCASAPKLSFQRNGTDVAGFTLSERRNADNTSDDPAASTSTTITKVLSVAESVSTGTYDVVVTNTDGEKGVCSACFTVAPAMTVTGNPNPTALGQGTTGGTITITGTNFPTGHLVGSITDPNADPETDSGMTASFVRDSDTQVRFINVNVDSDARLGARSLNLYSDATRDSLSIPFSVGGAPTATARTLLDGNGAKYGQGAQGVRVRVTGSGFVPGQDSQGTQIRFSPPTGLTVTSSTGESATSAIATIDIASDAPLGSRTLSVVNPDGGLADCATPGVLGSSACTLTISAAPAITSITPATAARGSVRTFTFSGSNLSDGDGGDGNTPPVITVGGLTEGTSSLDNDNKTTIAYLNSARASKTALGSQPVTLVNSDTRGRTTCATCFTITNLEVSGGSASGFNTGTKTNVTVPGAGFDPDATVELVKFGLGSTTVPSIAGTVTTAPSETTPGAADGTSLVASFPLAGVDPGTYAFRVTNPSSSPFPGVGQGGVFTVVANAPTLTGVAPNSRGTGAVGETIQLTGTNFARNPIIAFSNPGVSVTSVNRLDATRLDVTISIAESAAPGSGTIRVSNTDNQGAELPFSVVAGPRLSTTERGITPSSRTIGTSPFPAKVKGQQGTFAGTTLLFGASHITAANVSVTPGSAASLPNNAATDDTLDAIVTVGNGPAGRYDVIVRNTSNGGRATCAQCFTALAAVPSAPTGVTAVAGNGRATVSWTPGSDNGAAIESYRVTSTPGGFSSTVSGSPAPTSVDVPGLSNGVSYQFTVVATNGIGAGPASTLSNRVTPRTVPNAVTNVVATPADKSVKLAWTAPGNGGATITEYVVTTSPGGATTSVTGNPAAPEATIGGLTNGTAYSFTVAAVNEAGSGPVSAAAQATPRTTPGTPDGVTAVAAPRSATIAWTAPDDGGSPITAYVVKAAPGGQLVEVAGDKTTATVSGLASGVTHTFTVTAVNVAGSGAPSSSVSATTPLTTPSSPRAISAVAGDGQATVTWTEPADNGGAALTGYTVTTTLTNGTPVKTDPATGTSLTVRNLTNGTGYTFSVQANNSQGASAPSGTASATPRFVTKVTSTRSVATPIAGQGVTFSGVLTRASTGARIAGAKVILSVDPEFGATRTVQLTTSSTGVWSTRQGHRYNSIVSVRFAGDGQHAAVSAPNSKMPVATRVLRTSPAHRSSSSAKTTLFVKGNVAPNKAGRTVVLYKGSRPYTTGKVASNGTFSIPSRLPRGTYVLSVAIGRSPGNVFGRSAAFTITRR